MGVTLAVDFECPRAAPRGCRPHHPGHTRRAQRRRDGTTALAEEHECLVDLRKECLRARGQDLIPCEESRPLAPVEIADLECWRLA